MRIHRLRLVLPAAVVALGALVLAGCATSAPGAPTSTGDGGNGTTSPDGTGEVDAAWLDGGRMVAVVTDGSSSCVPVATDATADGQIVDITLEDRDEAACTDDLVPRASLSDLPAGADPGQDVTLRVTYGDIRDDVDLDGLASPAAQGGIAGGEPSAGWFADDGIVLLTWGSSTCVPQVEEVAMADAGATVTFAELGDRVCTMDMAPRATVIQLPQERAGDQPFTLTLTGGGLEGVLEVLES